MVGLSDVARFMVGILKPHTYLKQVCNERLTLLSFHQKHIGKKIGVRMYFWQGNEHEIEYLDTTGQQITAYLYDLAKSKYQKNPVVMVTYNGHYSMHRVGDNNA